MSFREDLTNAVRSGVCGYLNTVENATAYGTGIYPLRGVPQPFTGVANNIARTGIGLFCDTPPVDAIAPQFTGGQCTDRYRVIATYDRFVNGQFAATQVDQVGGQLYRGPIEEVFLTAGNQDVNVRHNNGQISDHLSGNPSNVTYRDIRDVRVENVDNSEDPCGSLGGGPDEPPPIGDRTVDIDINGDVGQLVIGLGGITVAGDLVAPITITGGNFELSGTVNFNAGEINFNFNGADPDNSPCCDQPPETENPPDEPDPPDLPDDGLPQIVGVLVTIESIDLSTVATTINQEDNPNIYAPNVGYVNFRFDLNNAYGWSVDIPVKNNRQFIPAPPGFVATRVAGTPRAGVTWTLTPVKGVAQALRLF